jgi:hypothetical protein
MISASVYRGPERVKPELAYVADMDLYQKWK